MNEMLKIISLKENEIDTYVEKRLFELDNTTNYKKISLSDDGGNIYNEWINPETPYLPSGYRSKGFKIDKKFFEELVGDIKTKFGQVPEERLVSKVNENFLIKWLNMYTIVYFGGDYDERKRKEIYGYGSLNSIGKTIDISELKGQNVARCLEISSALNSAYKFLGIDSSLVLSKANGVGHAYCLVNSENKRMIVDPNFYGLDENNKGIPCIFDFDINSKSCIYDPKEHGDVYTPRVDYEFPYHKITNKKHRI